MKGFTLIEVLVVLGITALIAGFLMVNFSRTRVDLNQASLLMQDAIRSVQSMALSGALYGTPGTYRCGYGIQFTTTGYAIYAGPSSSTVDCAAQSRTFTAGTDEIVRQAVLPDPSLEIVQPAPDIFFEPPNPTTYVNGSSAAGASAVVSVRRKGAACPSIDCRSISITSSGRIQPQ